MFVARNLKQKNIAEYLLYMWQVEDLIRASGGDIDTLAQRVIALYHPTPSQEQELRQWYGDLAEMMRAENVLEKGHLQICKNVTIQLTDLHTRLLHDPSYADYAAAYYRALPSIMELRAKNASAASQEPGLETCFEALYGITLLRMQKKDISPDTLQAAQTIARMLDLLSAYFRKEQKGELETKP